MGTPGRWLIAITAALGLGACQTTSEKAPQRSAVEQDLLSQLEQHQQYKASSPSGREVLTQVPDAVAATLAGPALPADSNSLFGPQKFDVNAKDVSVEAFFSGLVHDTPYSVAIHPAVKGEVSLALKQVTMEQIMQLVSDLYGYDISRSDTVYRIRPAGMRTETFAVNYLMMKRDGTTQTSITSGGVAQQNGNNSGGNAFNDIAGADGGNDFGGKLNNVNGTNISTRTETNFWGDLKVSLEGMIGDEDGRAVFVTPQAGLVTVRALPSEIQDIKHFLNVSETNLQKQVILEARILEVVLSNDYQQGINWNEIVAKGSTRFSLSTSAARLGNSVTTSLGGITSLSFMNEDFSGVLSLLSTQGNVQVLSSPRVTATNNQKAVIKVGDDEYFVTEVSSQSLVTPTATAVTPNVELTPFFSGIALDVTPQIDDKGSVLLHVHPSVIETQEQQKIVTVNGERLVLPLAQSTIRESDTIIRAASGEIVVIGGLMQTTRSDTESKTPLLGDIPVVGELFTNKRQQETKKELIILLKPTVVGAGTWAAQMERSRQTMADWLYVE